MMCPCGSPKCLGERAVHLLFGEAGMGPRDVAAELDVSIDEALRWARAHGEEPRPSGVSRGMQAGDFGDDVLVFKSAGGDAVHLFASCVADKSEKNPGHKRAGSCWDDTAVCGRCATIWNRRA